MNNPFRTGSSGKSFYAALSLSLAMVGAACWYAYSHNDSKQPERTAPAQTSAAPVTTARTVQTAAVTAAEPAEQAAAIFHRKTTQSTAYTTTTTTAAVTTVTFTVPAVTTAHVELPHVPVQGKPILAFTHGELMKSKTTGIWATHNGTDFAAAIGSDVYCTLDGTVTEIRRDPLWGVCVTVLHSDGTVSRYCGLNEALNVQSGDELERGTVIGTVGNTNEAESADEPHLHFEVMRNDEYIDAEFFLTGVTPQTPPDADEESTE
ncbi:MAG: M23 family metallopeptidase [Oscillospiraceae bacterium]|nr:M23 family metallopeptidase [Oscillospiraceae bacterium]